MHPGPAYVGELDGSITERAREVQRLLSHLTETELTTNIVGRLWAKQVHGSQVIMTALVNAPGYEVMGDERWRHLAVSLVSEAVSVAEAAGVTMPEGGTVRPALHHRRTAAATREMVDEIAAWVEALHGHRIEQARLGTHTYVKKASGIWWDLYYRRRQSETRSLTGALVDQADALGVPAPFNRRLVEMIYAIEAGEREPGYHNLEQLYAYGRQHNLLLPL